MADAPKSQEMAVSRMKPPVGDDQELITWAKRRLEEGFRLDEYRAKQNMAFVLGEQWGVWDARRHRFQRDTATRGDVNQPVRITINKIGSLVERVIARLTKNAPIPECRPVTDTQADVNAAKVGTRILDHELNARLKFQQRLLELYFWVLPLGWSFFHVRWDPNAGTVVGSDEDGAVHQGDIVLDEVPAFEIRLDPNARRFRDGRWVIRTVAMTPEAAYEQYGILPEGGDAAESIADEWRLASRTQEPDERKRTGQTPKPEQYIAVHQMWIKPGGRLVPDGLVFTWSGTTMLEPPMPFPYDHGELPFVPFNVLPATGGDPAGRTFVTDLIGMQRDYNDARSREATIRRQLTPKIVAPVGSIDPNRITSRVEVIPYNPIGTAPSLMLPDGRWMSQFESAMNRVDQEMGDRAGQQDVSQGKAASSAPAAGILALQEADETKLAISAKELAAGVEQLGYQVLMLVKQFWTEERTIRTWSRDGVLEVEHFRGSDLGEHLDVHVSAESALPRSKTARTQLAMDLFQAGILTEPRDLVRMLDLPGTDFLVETLNVDAAQANREHGYLLRGEDVLIRTFDNHAVHIAEHDKFRKSEEYEHLPPELQAHFDGHVDAHYQVVLQQMTQPTPPGTPMYENMVAQANAGMQNPSGENGQPTDPMTGAPSNPNAIGGNIPTGLNGAQAQASQTPIGGTGNPGPVPGHSRDTQMFREGN
jgi:hypothetical protein